MGKNFWIIFILSIIFLIEGEKEGFARQSTKDNISINSKPEGAEIYVEKVYKGKTPLTLYLQPYTPYHITANLSGYKDYEITTYVEPDETTSLEILLEKTQTGYLYITSIPPEASIYLNGNLIGNTPIRNYEFKEGNYTISAKKEGYTTIEKGIAVSGNGKLTFVNLSLTSIPLSIENRKALIESLKKGVESREVKVTVPPYLATSKTEKISSTGKKVLSPPLEQNLTEQIEKVVSPPVEKKDWLQQKEVLSVQTDVPALSKEVNIQVGRTKVDSLYKEKLPEKLPVPKKEEPVTPLGEVKKTPSEPEIIKIKEEVKPVVVSPKKQPVEIALVPKEIMVSPWLDVDIPVELPASSEKQIQPQKPTIEKPKTYVPVVESEVIATLAPKSSDKSAAEQAIKDVIGRLKYSEECGVQRYAPELIKETKKLIKLAKASMEEGNYPKAIEFASAAQKSCNEAIAKTDDKLKTYNRNPLSRLFDISVGVQPEKK